MLHFVVNKDICIGCGRCIRDCLPQALEMSDEIPVMAHEQRCIRCRHCLAVCPVGAVSFGGRAPAESTLLKDRFPSPEQMAVLMKGRRSVRRYKQENVDPTLLARVLDAAAHAPTGVNARRLHVTLIDNIEVMHTFRRNLYARLSAPDIVALLRNTPRADYFLQAPALWSKGVDVIFRHAPHCVIVSNAKDAPCRDQDPLIYLSYLELMAQSAGLGTLWCGLLYHALRLMPEFMSRLGIPETHELGYAMMLGVADVHYERTVEYGPAEIHHVGRFA